MDILFVILPLALLIAAIAVAAFVWAARSGQFDDLDTPGRRMLLDDIPVPSQPEEEGEAAEGGSEAPRKNEQ